jgi:hypothetical protein
VADYSNPLAEYSIGLQQSAHVARDLSLAQSAETNIKVDELKRIISTVSEIISKIGESMSLTDGQLPYGHATVAPAVAGSQPTSSLLSISPLSMTSHPMDVHSNLDGQDGSRKRCASSIASGSVDRVIKAPKMEPPDDVLLASSLKPSPLPASHMFSTPAASYSAAVVVNRSLPPSAPPSRPQTPGPNANILQQSPPVLSPPSQAIDFGVPITISSQSAPSFPLGARNRSSWSDTAATLPHRHHQHSLSGTSLNTAINLHGLTMVPSSTGQPFTAPGTFGTPSVQGLTMQRPAANGGITISPPLGRMTRSGSITTPAVNPMPYGYVELPNLDSFDYMSSRTSISASAPVKVNPESDDGEETEDEYGDSMMRGGMHSHVSRL